MAASIPRNNAHTKFSPKPKLRANDVAKQPYISFPQRLLFKFKNIKFKLSTSQSDPAKLSSRFKISEISQKLLCHSSPTPQGQ